MSHFFHAPTPADKLPHYTTSLQCVKDKQKGTFNHKATKETDSVWTVPWHHQMINSNHLTNVNHYIYKCPNAYTCNSWRMVCGASHDVACCESALCWTDLLRSEAYGAEAFLLSPHEKASLQVKLRILLFKTLYLQKEHVILGIDDIISRINFLL